MFINLTPHAFTFVTSEGTIVVEASGQLARVSAIEVPEGIIEGIPVFGLSYGEVSGLPDPVDGVAYLVSRMVRDAVPDRTDVFYPTRLIRDDEGRIVGCEGLAH